MLFGGEDLSEDFQRGGKPSSGTINERTGVEAELYEAYEVGLSEAVEKLQQEVTERLDDYLGCRRELDEENEL